MQQTHPAVPPFLRLRVTPQAFDLIRVLLGEQPHDKVSGLCAELNAQVRKQVEAYNEVASNQTMPTDTIVPVETDAEPATTLAPWPPA